LGNKSVLNRRTGFKRCIGNLIYRLNNYFDKLLSHSAIEQSCLEMHGQTVTVEWGLAFLFLPLGEFSKQLQTDTHGEALSVTPVLQFIVAGVEGESLHDI
jgi:hypothetical protein